MTDLTPHVLDGYTVRPAELDDGQPALVLADIARILGYRDASDAARLLRDHHKGYAAVRTPGGVQRMLAVTERGLNRLVIRSNAANAERVQDWLTDDVLPSIRKTGGYSTAPALTEDEIVHQALTITARKVEALTARVAELEPRAAVADHLLDATGDMSVGDAAKTLARSGAHIGQQRLFEFLDAIGWTYRRAGVRHIYQSAIEAGVLAALPKSHHHPRTGELVIDPPQVRVTAKGIARLLPRLLPTEEAA